MMRSNIVVYDENSIQGSGWEVVMKPGNALGTTWGWRLYRDGKWTGYEKSHYGSYDSAMDGAKEAKNDILHQERQLARPRVVKI